MQSQPVMKLRSIQEIDADIAALEKKYQELIAERAIADAGTLASRHSNQRMFKPVETLSQERERLQKQKIELSRNIQRVEAAYVAKQHRMATTVINGGEVICVMPGTDYGRIWNEENTKLFNTQNRLDELDALIKLAEVKMRGNVR